MIQNAAARLVFNLPKFSHTTPLLRSLHWLPVAARIRFKTLMLAYKAKNGPAPSYLKALVTSRTAPRLLRSTSTARLVPPSLREKDPLLIFYKRAVLSVSPQSWLTEGDSVTLSCEVTDSSTDWTYSWYTVVPYRDGLTGINNNRGYSVYVELLSDSSRGSGGNYTLSPAALKHTGVYMCRGERGEPVLHTQYSNPQPLWITGESFPVSLIINPSRTQHFTNDSLSLSCEDQSNSTGWTVRRYTHSEIVLDCSHWGSVTGSTCNISFLSTSYTGVYWCESESGENSNPVNITVHDGDVILESPVHPVTEGHPLTLRCLYHNPNPSNLRADFYKDGSVLQNQTTGEMIIQTVSKSDEGFYHCKHPERGESPKSWLSVRPSGPSGVEAPFSVLMLICSVVTASPYLLVTFILLLICYRAPASYKHPRCSEWICLAKDCKAPHQNTGSGKTLTHTTAQSVSQSLEGQDGAQSTSCDALADFTYGPGSR
ncbi:hypothetical protein QTP70_001466 [Hemibagrus guttatus]|uniref:Ig-like domain-containing protein n=1 Tax=Hemibagrus guttatus TaxID=175788 RepID=A0AAE0R674_9TELE|nr:hypothetical protein QTP70_001466 [Hemibagrus guttatus]